MYKKLNKESQLEVRMVGPEDIVSLAQNTHSFVALGTSHGCLVFMLAFVASYHDNKTFYITRWDDDNHEYITDAWTHYERLPVDRRFKCRLEGAAFDIETGEWRLYNDYVNVVHTYSFNTRCACTMAKMIKRHNTEAEKANTEGQLAVLEQNMEKMGVKEDLCDF